ncbi:MAG: hypothetical protein CMK59_11080 [Proteobacteria bacterium]|nr:hypothetical protein [Pseudomonadota bacterium]
MNSAESYVERTIKQLRRVPKLLFFGILLERRTSNFLQAQSIQRKKKGRFISNCEHEIYLELTLYFSQKEPVYISMGMPFLSSSELLKRIEEEYNAAADISKDVEPLQFDIETKGLMIKDPRYVSIDEDGRRAILDFNIDSLYSIDPRIRISALEFEDVFVERKFFSNDRPVLVEESTFFRLKGSFVLPFSLLPLAAGQLQGRYLSDVASRPLQAVLLKTLFGAQPRTFDLEDCSKLVLKPCVVSQIIEQLLPAFDLRRIEAGESFLAAHRGARIGTTAVHVLDSADYTYGSNTRAFDAQGVPPMMLTLIREGMCDALYIDSLRALEDEICPTGHVGLSQKLWYGNILIKAGRRSLNMIMQEDDVALTILYCTEPVQIDLKTGECSFVGYAVTTSSKKSHAHFGLVYYKGPVLDILNQVEECTNHQIREGFIDACEWILPAEALDKIEILNYA